MGNRRRGYLRQSTIKWALGSAAIRSFVLGGVLCGCSNPTEYTYLGLGATAYFSQAPANEIEQIYYLGVFDPQDQVPPTIYRVTVRGQASALSQMKFGSGWVHSSLIDSLQTHVSFPKESDRATIESAAAGETGADKISGLQTGRRLVMFGPEGFREAPRDHRLVIVMGSSPDKFFAAMDQSLSFISKLEATEIDPKVAQQIHAAAAKAMTDRARLGDLQAELAKKPL